MSREPSKKRLSNTYAPPVFSAIGVGAGSWQTASAAGMYAAGALWGFRGAEELSAAGAHILLKTPADLLVLFK